VSSDAAPAPSFSPLFGKTLSRQPLTCPASAQTTIWCKKRAKDEKIGFKTINARAETVDSAHSFRSAFKKRRCLISADGFYEWKKVIGGKIRYSIGMNDDSRFVFADLWEGSQNPETQEWLRTCTIITGQTNELVAEIHTRMPVILPPETHERWLTGEAGKELLLPFPGEAMKIRAVPSR
jgi:putative SOS response-associated peptidase YedK